MPIQTQEKHDVFTQMRYNISKDYGKGLIFSMTNMIQALTKSKGDFT